MTITDRYLNLLLRYPSGLRADAEASDERVVASYWTASGERSFSFCHGGLLIDPDGAKRFVAFGEISESGLYDTEVGEAFKAAVKAGAPVVETLALKLVKGDSVEIALNQRSDHMSERLTVASLVERYVRYARIAHGGGCA